MAQASKAVREFLRTIGSKGGKIGGPKTAGTPTAKERAKKAAKARWSKAKKRKSNEISNTRGARLRLVGVGLATK